MAYSQVSLLYGKGPSPENSDDEIIGLGLPDGRIVVRKYTKTGLCLFDYSLLGEPPACQFSSPPPVV